jgi:hypothetical protein
MKHQKQLDSDAIESCYLYMHIKVSQLINKMCLQ